MNVRREEGFTLLELIGVMAVLAILSAALAPAIFDGIDDAYAAAENANLSRLSDDLDTYIRRTGSIPSRTAATFAAALATVSSTPALNIQTNRRRFNRLFYFDPQFFGSPDSNFNGYVQTTGLTVAPASPRLMIISDLKRNVPNQPAVSATFNAIWNQSAGAALVESDSLKIARINLAPMFHRVFLSNASPAQAAYQLGAATAAPVTASSGAADGIISRFVLDGTQLNLYSQPFPSGGFETATLVTNDVAFQYATNGTSWFWEQP